MFSDKQPADFEVSTSGENNDFLLVADEAPAQPRPGNGLAVTALLMPIVAGAVQSFFSPSPNAILVVSFAMVLNTAALLAADVSRLRRWDKVRGVSSSPELTFMSVLLLWIIFYPLAFFERRKFGCPNLGPASIGSVVAFLLLPFVVLDLRGPQLPACDDIEIIQLVDQLIRAEFPDARVDGSTAHREVQFDSQSQVRTGTCVVRIDSRPISIPYRIVWQNQNSSQRMCVVNLTILPTCKSPQVIAALEPLIRKELAELHINSIIAFREIKFDQQQKCRYGVCIAQTDSAEIPVSFIVQWKDESRSLFEVRGYVLPSPADERVAEIIRKIVDQSASDAEMTSIDGFRELHSDWQGGKRFGGCVVRSGVEQQELRFVVRWNDEWRGSFAVELITDDSI